MEIENKRRALFEAQITKSLTIDGYDSISLSSIMERGTNGDYYSVRISGAWRGFNLALDTVAITLPDCFKMSIEELDDGYNAGHLKMEILSAIESAGLGIRLI